MSDPLEMGRRLKRSLDGYITYRKAAGIAVLIFVFFIYIGPGFLKWIWGSSDTYKPDPLAACLQDKLGRWAAMLEAGNGHLEHRPKQDKDSEYLPYVGNGYIGIEVHPDSQINIKAKRTLSVPVRYKPIIDMSLEGGGEVEEATVTDYKSGAVHRVQCLADSREARNPVIVTTAVYAHRTLRGVLVQDVKVYNPGNRPVQLAIEKLGIANWDTARSVNKVIEHGDGGQKYSVVTGTVEVGDQIQVVAVASRKIGTSLEVQSRMTQSLHVLTSVAHSDLMDKSNIDSGRREQEKAAIASIQTASSMTWQSLQEGHATVWQSLWTTGFGISWSYAEEAVNGARINATMYYVLSQAPTPLHSTHTTQPEKAELHSYLSYTEGCYSGVFTLQASNLWTPLDTLNNVNTVVSFWLLTLEKNGCHNLIKAGADGVVQAMVLSLPGLKFSNQHLELAVHPKELHRDLVIRRLNYGNETHVNISVVVQDDNRAAIFVSLDKKNKDYFACDGGCLDAPVRLGPSPIMFPVKLTEPPTAILYITADHEHMIDLKHTIHVKEVADAPAHEQHVLELHRHGARLGGLPAIFWVSIAFLILVFHLFLFRLIYNEYCAQPDKYRIRKYSDYN